MYTAHYGFSDAPFQLTPDPRFWFASSTHKRAMAYLGYGLAQGEGFIVVTGDIGAGKTILVGHLLATIDPARIAAISIVTTQVAGDDMLRLIAQALGLPTEGVEKAQLLDRIERHLIETGRSGRRTLVIVDEAQNLSVSALEELRMLSNFQAGGRALLQFLLLGQPEFRDRLAAAGDLEQLRQRVIATHHLNPMGPEETRSYLEHRLALVGWAGRPDLTGDACAALHAASGGVPRKLNTLATRALVVAAVDGVDTIDGARVARVMADLNIDPPQSDAPVTEPPLAGADRVPPADPPDLAARIAALEAQQQHQEAALRRVLTLLVDWVERDAPAPLAADARLQG